MCPECGAELEKLRQRVWSNLFETEIDVEWVKCTNEDCYYEDVRLA